jgi:hypothetical protein
MEKILVDEDAHTYEQYVVIRSPENLISRRREGWNDVAVLVRIRLSSRDKSAILRGQLEIIFHPEDVVDISQ